MRRRQLHQLAIPWLLMQQLLSNLCSPHAAAPIDFLCTRSGCATSAVEGEARLRPPKPWLETSCRSDASQRWSVSPSFSLSSFHSFLQIINQHLTTIDLIILFGNLLPAREPVLPSFPGLRLRMTLIPSRLQVTRDLVPRVDEPSSVRGSTLKVSLFFSLIPASASHVCQRRVLMPR